MTKNYLHPMLMCDGYKLGHRIFQLDGTTFKYATFTPRSNKYMPRTDEVLVFGIQKVIKEYLIGYFNTEFFGKPINEIVERYIRIVKPYLGEETVEVAHIEELHALGYLPIRIKALKEGTLSPFKVPVLTIENTHPNFAWLPTYLETLISTELWQSITSATIAKEYRKIADKYALETTGSTDGVDFQCHDFSMRGMSSVDTSVASAMAHLVPFRGTDTLGGIEGLIELYNADINKELIGASIYATEHSVMSQLTSADGDRDEYEAFKHIITKVRPKGLVAVVSDTYDFDRVVTETLPRLKEEIMNRDGKLIIRPDSGDPVDILCGEVAYNVDFTKVFDGEIKNLEDYIYDEAREWANEDCEGAHNCGCDEYTVRFKIKDKIYLVDVGFSYNRHDKTYYYVEKQGFSSEGVQWDTLRSFDITSKDKGLIESLWDTFGGTVNEQGYKVLDSHIGAIYGEAITLERAETIFKKLKEKGFASTNVTFGIGSYTYNTVSRDTLGQAMKATYSEINGKPMMMLKDPKTDDGTKKSHLGMVAVLENPSNDWTSPYFGKLTVIDGLTRETYKDYKLVDRLETVFLDGKLVREQSLSEIREFYQSQIK